MLLAAGRRGGRAAAGPRAPGPRGRAVGCRRGTRRRRARPGRAAAGALVVPGRGRARRRRRRAPAQARPGAAGPWPARDGGPRRRLRAGDAHLQHLAPAGGHPGIRRDRGRLTLPARRHPRGDPARHRGPRPRRRRPRRDRRGGALRRRGPPRGGRPARRVRRQPGAARPRWRRLAAAVRRAAQVGVRSARADRADASGTPRRGGSSSRPSCRSCSSSSPRSRSPSRGRRSGRRTWCSGARS